MHTDYIIFCKDIQTTEDGCKNILGTFTGVVEDKFPITIEFCLATLISIDDKDFELHNDEINLKVEIDKDGEVFKVDVATVNSSCFTNDPQNRVNFEKPITHELDGPGKVTVTVSGNGLLLGRSSFLIVKEGEVYKSKTPQDKVLHIGPMGSA